MDTKQDGEERRHLA